MVATPRGALPIYLSSAGIWEVTVYDRFSSWPYFSRKGRVMLGIVNPQPDHATALSAAVAGNAESGRCATPIPARLAEHEITDSPCSRAAFIHWRRRSPLRCRDAKATHSVGAKWRPCGDHFQRATECLAEFIVAISCMA